jgi:hypothetical protein
VKIHVAAAVEVLRKKKREDENQFTTVEKPTVVWVAVISFCKISFPLMHLMGYYAETALSRPLTA